MSRDLLCTRNKFIVRISTTGKLFSRGDSLLVAATAIGEENNTAKHTKHSTHCSSKHLVSLPVDMHKAKR
jgi:hypothetical protein